MTGRPGLTYQEAVECENKAKKQIAAFPEYLQKPILYLATLTQRSRINDMNDDVFQFTKDRYFVNEIVEVMHDGERYVVNTKDNIHIYLKIPVTIEVSDI